MWSVLVGLLAFGALAGPASVSVSRLAGFDTAVISHVNRAIGTENLPSAKGTVVQNGMWVTLGRERLDVFDHQALELVNGRPQDPATTPRCVSGCPAAFFQAFEREWLELGVEAASLGRNLPDRVWFAAHARLPARTLVDVAYAASESRPGQPPLLGLLLNSPGRGLRAQPFYLVPPAGLEFRQGAGAALALTIKVGHSVFIVSASDPEFVRERRLKSLTAVRTLVKKIKKKYPGKETVVLVPSDQVSVGELLRAAVTVRDDFPVVVLSAGQEVRV